MVQNNMVADQTMSLNKTLLKNILIKFNRRGVVVSAGPQVITDCSTFQNCVLFFIITLSQRLFPNPSWLM